MEISRQRIGQSIYETFYNKCNCCSGSGYKKADTIIIHDIISLIKSIHAIGNKDDIEIKIDEEFYSKNSKEIEKKIKIIKLSFKINFIKLSALKEIFEFNQDLLNKIRDNNKDIIEKNKIDDFSTEKSYRRKIKKKIIENQY